MTSFGGRLSRLRQQHRPELSQDALARALNSGVVGNTVSRWERDISHPTPAAIVALARFFDVSTDYLLGLTDEERPAGEPRDAEGDQEAGAELASEAQSLAEGARRDRRRTDRRRHP